MTAATPVFVLVPGAWCRAEIWDAVVERLRTADQTALALTLSGLEESSIVDPHAIGLEDHVDDVLRLLDRRDLREVVLVGHSYSGLVVGQVADRAPVRIARTIFLQAFLPVQGRSLLDDFGPDAAAEEARQIERDGGWWAPPTEDGLAQEPDLDTNAARALRSRLTPHPGRTVLGPARMRQPHTDLDARFVLGADSELPAALRDVPPRRIQRIDAGHYSMITAPDVVAEVLLSNA